MAESDTLAPWAEIVPYAAPMTVNGLLLPPRTMAGNVKDRTAKAVGL